MPNAFYTLKLLMVACEAVIDLADGFDRKVPAVASCLDSLTCSVELRYARMQSQTPTARITSILVAVVE